MLPLCTRVTVLRLLSIAYWMRHAHQPLRSELRHRLDADARVRAGCACPSRVAEELDDALGLRRARRPLDAGVDVFGVLAEDDDVHQLGMLDRRGHALEVADRAHAGVEVEHLAQRHVQAADAAADRRRQRSLDRDLVRRAPPRACRSAATRRTAPWPSRRPALRTTRSSSCRRTPCSTAASKTRTLARQMSGPVPSPSI